MRWAMVSFKSVKPMGGEPVAKKQAKQVTKERGRVTKKEKKENRLVRYFREVRAEVSKVTWPSRREALNLTGVVLAVMLFMSLFLGLVDWIFSRLFGLILG